MKIFYEMLWYQFLAYCCVTFGNWYLSGVLDFFRPLDILIQIILAAFITKIEMDRKRIKQ